MSILLNFFHQSFVIKISDAFVNNLLNFPFPLIVSINFPSGLKPFLKDAKNSFKS